MDSHVITYAGETREKNHSSRFLNRNLYGLIEVDKEGKIMDVNSGLCEITEFKATELIGIKFSLLIPAGKEFNLHPWLDEQASSLIEQKTFQWDLLKKTGKRIRVKLSLIKDLREAEKSNSAAIIAVSTVSENDLLHQFLNLLNISQQEEPSGNIFERLAKGIADAVPIPYVIIGEYQKEEEKILAKAFWAKDHFRESSYKLEDTPCELIFEHGAPIFFPRNIQHLFPKDGFLRDKTLHSYYGLPLFNSKDEIIGHLVMFGEEEMEVDWIPENTLIHFSRHVAFELERSIYESKQAKSLARFQTLAKSAPMGIVLADPKGNIQFANPAFSEIIGNDIQEIIGKSFKDFTLEEDIDSNLEDLREVVQGKRSFISLHKRYKHKSGKLIWAKVTISSMLPKGSNEPEVIAIVEDITEKVHRDQEVNRINEAYEQQRLLMVAGEKVAHSSSWIYDYAKGKLIPSPGLSELYDLDSSLSDEKEILAQIMQKISLEDLDTIRSLAKTCMEKEESSSYDYLLRLSNGEARWLRSTFTNWEGGKKLMGTTMDVSQEKNTLNELIKTQDELEQWIYSVTHDLRTPLGHIEGFSEWLMEEAKYKLSQDGISYLESIISASERIDLMTRDLLEYAWTRKVSLQQEWLDLNMILNDSKKSLAPDRNFKQIKWEIENLPKVYADRSMMYSLMDNLLSNAIKYSKDSEPPHIKVWADVEPNKVFIHFKDNGVGFDMREADRLFNFFERLHHGKEYQGSGVGLANVQQILLRHNGNISAKGEPGKGAVFTVYLPLDHCK